MTSKEEQSPTTKVEAREHIASNAIPRDAYAVTSSDHRRTKVSIFMVRDVQLLDV